VADQLSALELARLTLADRADQLRWAAARLPLAADLEAVPDCRMALRRLREVWMALGDQLEPQSSGPQRRLRQLSAELRPLERAEARIRLLLELGGPVGAGGEGGPSGWRGREPEALRSLLDSARLEEATLREQILSRRLISKLEAAASLGAVVPPDGDATSAVQLARARLPLLFEAASRSGRPLEPSRRRRIQRLLHGLELFSPALARQHQVVLAELASLLVQLGQLREGRELVEWVDRAAKQGPADLRPALRRIVVREELETEAAQESAEIELSRLDQGGWWRTAALACLPERRRSSRSRGS
jgi:hypothetical protein